MRAVVTGGGGFLGSRIARMLQERGDDVLVLGRGQYPHHKKAGIETIQTDIRNLDALQLAFRDRDVVFHVAAIASIWGKRKTFWAINVDGTRNVINACRACGVGKLIYTSSPSVVFGRGDVCGVDESQPYPDRYIAIYPETKAVAERLVLATNNSELATVALRPHLIWGPHDPNLIPRLIARARAGKLIQVGDGTNLVDITYVDNAAEAHLLAADVLTPQAACAGRPYFISQGTPVALWPWINDMLAAVGAPPVTRSISFRAAFLAGTLCEIMYKVAMISSEPPMTRFVASQFSQSHYFNIEAAQRDLGYRPTISSAEGLKRLVASTKYSDPT